MKVKFLLMPSAIIISMVLAIWYIWPTWFDKNLDDSITNLRSTIAKEQTELDKVKQRKKNVDLLATELQNDTANKSLVFGYYPVIRKEEDVINKINHIAFGAGVFLTEINVEYGKIDKKNDSMMTLAIPAEKEATAVTDVEKALLSAGKVEKTPGFVTADINVYGDYDQIKNFLYSLYATGLLNNVRIFDIHKGDENVAEGEAPSNKLSADIKVSFGYISKKNDQAVDLIDNDLFAAGRFNMESLNENRSLMSEKYPNSEIGERGSTNPFTP